MFFPLLSMCNSGQKKQSHIVKIFQYEGTDSLKKILAVTQVFNSKDQLVFEEYHQDYEETSEGTTYRFGVGSRHMTYRDTSVIKTVGIMRGDSVKSFAFYNDQGLLIKARFFRYEKKLKPNVDKGLGRPGGCVILPKDYEERRVWQEGSTSIYQYNSKGKRIRYMLLRDSTVLEKQQCSYYKSGELRENSSFNNDDATPSYRTLYFYDWRGRLSKQVSYTDKEVSATNYYSYPKNAVYIDGNYLAYPRAESISKYRNLKKMDSKGRLVEEVGYVGQCPLETRKLLRYRSDGKLAQTILFTCRDSSRLVHDYVYQ
ncbi:MAG: hypothetical protein M3Y54_17565 [Bacteroidota bacterium]|nr:hypothetical protein [Bacteroidota bacterium]